MDLLSHCTLFILILASIHEVYCSDNTVKNFFKKVQVSPSFNTDCVLEHCVQELIVCGLHKNCREDILCLEACFDEQNKNLFTLAKLKLQECANKCAFTYSKERTLNKLMTCLTDNACYSLPLIPSTCKGSSVKPIKPLSLSDLQGHWWVVRGYHPVYDCYPCSQFELEPLNETAWYYAPKYVAYKVDGGLKFITDLNVVIFQTTPGEKISFSFNYLGFVHHTTWWLIDKADDSSYVLMYYCGSSSQWNYEGAMVLARSRTLSADDYAKIAAAYKQAVGLDLQQFCYPITSEYCPM